MDAAPVKRKVGRPRKTDSAKPPTKEEAKLEDKRKYMREYQQQRKSQITKLNEGIKKCEDELKVMKEKRKELRDYAKAKLDSKMEKDFDPDEYAKGGMKYVRKVMDKNV